MACTVWAVRVGQSAGLVILSAPGREGSVPRGDHRVPGKSGLGGSWGVSGSISCRLWDPMTSSPLRMDHWVTKPRV
eukprot:4025919-Lingulodinium_polyedra.AAC.1